MEENLNELILGYYNEKQELDKSKKIVDEYNKEIKEGLAELGVDEFNTRDGLVAKVSTQKRESFNEPALIEKLLELDIKEAVELVPQINWDKVEDLIYNGKLDAAELTPYKEVKEVITLKVSKKKGE